MVQLLRCTLHPTSFLSNTDSYENCRDAPCTKFLWDKIFANALKVATSAMLSLTQEKNLRIKFSLMGAGGEIGKNFLLVKISSCTVLSFLYYFCSYYPCLCIFCTTIPTFIFIWNDFYTYFCYFIFTVYCEATAGSPFLWMDGLIVAVLLIRSNWLIELQKTASINFIDKTFQLVVSLFLLSQNWETKRNSWFKNHNNE